MKMKDTVLSEIASPLGHTSDPLQCGISDNPTHRNREWIPGIARPEKW